MTCVECKGTSEMREQFDPIFGGIRIVCADCIFWERWGKPRPKRT